MSRVQSRRSDLARLLADCRSPVYVVDGARRIVGCNPAALAWLECEADELLGQRCDYHSEVAAARGAALAASLCPPPEVFLGQRRRACLAVAAPDGGLKWRWADFTPLAIDADGGGAIVVLDGEDGDPAHDPTANMTPSPAAKALHERLLRFRHAAARRFALDRLVGASPWMERARAQAALAASGRESVLIVGPAGCGKQHLAKAIHYARSGDATPLVPFAAADAGPELFQTIVGPLVGRQGGATESPSAPATLLILDVDQLAVELQAELRRLLAGHLFRAAIIATASRSLVELATAGRFRFDLACALGTTVIELPPLARRPEDIPLLAQALLESINAEGGKQASGFATDALDRLVAYEWPRNIDELAEAIDEAHASASGPLVTLADLPRRLHFAADAARRPRPVEEPIELNTFLHDVERELITRALQRTKGNKSKAARLLGLTRPRLYRRMVQLGLEFRPSE